MNLIAYLLKSRGLVNSMQRLPTIVTRFGVSTAKMDRALNGYVDIANAYGTVPTLAVTANLIERHPRVFERQSQRGAELAIHGRVHSDYSAPKSDTQRAAIRRGTGALARAGAPAAAWRTALSGFSGGTSRKRDSSSIALTPGVATSSSASGSSGGSASLR